MKKTMISPMDAKNTDVVCKMESDNFNTKNFWIMSDAEFITIARQSNGEPLINKIDIPKKDFDRMVKWYTNNQKLAD